jgi:transposase-like protein
VSNEYPKEFREKIKALAESGQKLSDLAREYSINLCTLHFWANRGQWNIKQFFRQRLTAEDKLHVTQRAVMGQNKDMLLEEYNVSRSALNRWMREYREKTGFADNIAEDKKQSASHGFISTPSRRQKKVKTELSLAGAMLIDQAAGWAKTHGWRPDSGRDMSRFHDDRKKFRDSICEAEGFSEVAHEL